MFKLNEAIMLPSELITRFHYLGIFLLLILGGFGFPFPEDATLILTGIFLSAGDVKLLPALVAVYLGVVVSDIGLYYAGRVYGRRIVRHRFFSRIIKPERLDRVEERFKKYGVLAILFGRHIPGVRAQILIASGILRVPFIKYLLADTFAMAFTIALWIWAGYKGAQYLPQIRSAVKDSAVGIFIGAFALMAAYGLYRYLKARREQARTGDAGKRAA